MPTAKGELRSKFFDYVFDDLEGYICIATSDPDIEKKNFKQTFYEWPKQRAELAEFVDKVSHRKNVWFCVNLLDKPERKKANCRPGNLVWSDLDLCNPNNVEPFPPCIIESSPQRFQAIWHLDTIVSPDLQEEYSKKIAYKYVTSGADPSGWDLTQLLRVPFTNNYKYGNAPQVELRSAEDGTLSVDVFESIVVPSLNGGTADSTDDDMPDMLDLPDVHNVIYKYNAPLRISAFKELYLQPPADGADWSKLLWKLVNICIEAGMDKEEAFAVCMVAPCNKYARDNRPPKFLWRDVVKVEMLHTKMVSLGGDFAPLAMPTLVTDQEIDAIEPSFLDEYRAWGAVATDAPIQYHELCGAMIMSSILAGGLKLNTTFGPLIPNLWGLVLGDTTITRKSTAMGMARDLMLEIDPSIMVATDGSAEGVLTALAGRAHKTSMFYKDEVSGFFDSINKKDYLAGLPETLTLLYDVPPIFTRLLRKETITIVSPVFIFFGGGIREQVYENISEQYIMSGFLPRFLIVGGDTDITSLRRIGPENPTGGAARAKLQGQLADMYELYNREVPMKVGDATTMVHQQTIVELTDDAWRRSGEIEKLLTDVAYDSPLRNLALPTFTRMAMSLLKLSMLLAASRQEPVDNKIIVELKDITHAARYIQDWGRYSVDLIHGSGKGRSERMLDNIMTSINTHPGVTRSSLMNRHHLSKREADDILGTLEDRQTITTRKSGRGTRVWAT